VILDCLRLSDLLSSQLHDYEGNRPAVYHLHLRHHRYLQLLIALTSYFHDPKTSTTGQPKGLVRDNGGHAVAVHLSMEYLYGINPEDVWWAASDVGWVVCTMFYSKIQVMSFLWVWSPGWTLVHRLWTIDLRNYVTAVRGQAGYDRLDISCQLLS
jgi:hypothetical protein